MLQIDDVVAEPEYHFAFQEILITARWVTTSNGRLYWQINGADNNLAMFWMWKEGHSIESVTLPYCKHVEHSLLADVEDDLPVVLGLPVANLERHSLEWDDGMDEEIDMLLQVGEKNLLLNFEIGKPAVRVIKCREVTFYIASSNEIQSIQFHLSPEDMVRWRTLYQSQSSANPIR